MKTVIMGNVISMAQWKEDRARDRDIAVALASDPVETGQFTRDWLDSFADVRHELQELIDDIESRLNDKEPQR